MPAHWIHARSTTCASGRYDKIRISSVGPMALRMLVAMPTDARVMRSKRCITPFGLPVEPEVYISIAMSSAARAGCPLSGSFALVIASQCANADCAEAGASGNAMHGTPAGTALD